MSKKENKNVITIRQKKRGFLKKVVNKALKDILSNRFKPQ